MIQLNTQPNNGVYKFPPNLEDNLIFIDEIKGVYVGEATKISPTLFTTDFDVYIYVCNGQINVKEQLTNKTHNLASGDGVIISKGTTCEWQHNEGLRLFFVIYRPINTEKASPIVHNSILVVNKETSALTPSMNTRDGHKKQVFYQNSTKQFVSGIWSSKAFPTNQISFPYHELMIIKDGSLTCTDEKDIKHTFKQGDVVFMPLETLASWQVDQKVSLFYVQIK